MMKKLEMSIIGCVVAVLICGCASVSPQLYALIPTAAPSGEASDLAVTVGPVSVPEAVDRPQLVSIVAPNKLRVDEFNRWASPLKNGIARTVAEHPVVVFMKGEPEQPRCVLQVDDRQRRVDFVHAGIEDAAHAEAPHARHHAGRRDGTLGDGNHHRIACGHAELGGKLRSEHHRERSRLQ